MQLNDFRRASLQSAVGLSIVWKYTTALVVGTLLVGFVIRLRLSRRKKRTGRIDVGPLSDSWLAEQRSQRDDRP
jgi:hypothetical protein